MASAWLVVTLVRAARNPLWMDEVLTLWLVRLPGPVAIYQALIHGAQYNPPAHPDLLYYWMKVAGSGYLALRLPSVVGSLITAVTIFTLIHRYLCSSIATAGFVLCLCPPLAMYATQLRPYSLTLACLTVAILAWDSLRTKPNHPLLLTAIVLLLSTAIALHLFCVFYVVSLGVTELLYARKLRAFRPWVWLAYVLSGMSTLLWLPLIHSFQQYTHGDHGPLYAGSPTLPHFLLSLIALASQSIFFALALGVVLVGMIALQLEPRINLPRHGAWPLSTIAVGLASLPLIEFLAALVLNGTYTGRYVLPGALGAVLLTCVAVNTLPDPARSTAVPLTALVVGLLSLLVSTPPAPTTRLNEVFTHATQPYPFALAEGLLFFAEKEDQRLTPQQRDRLTYLTIPPGYSFGDPTAERQVMRWKAIDPRLAVAPVDSLLSSHQCFYVYDTHQTDDDISRYLQQIHLRPVATTHVNNGDLSTFCP